MKRAFRFLGLTVALTLAAFSTVHAASGICRIKCSDGRSLTDPSNSGSACCQLFQSFCGGDGHATWTSGTVTFVCPV
ncbi:MAG TPA: hypothetical protein VLX28_08070 [Thermoanaerobaculia bacterium]|nr:hypothetical protein [Thermoanaerobaculia bacterium]